MAHLLKLAAFIAVISLGCVAAGQAQVGTVGGPGFYAPAAAGYTGPGDITSFTAWYGLRAYTAAEAAAATAKMINIENMTSTHTCDVIVATSGGLGVTANCSSGADNGKVVWNGSTGFCDGVVCAVLTVYDRTGGGRDVTTTAATSHPAVLVQNCLHTTLPCIQMPLSGAGGTQFFQSAANFTPATGLVSISAVGNRSSGTTEVLWLQEDGGNNRSKNTSANTHACLSSAGAINQTASDGNWHAFGCILGGAGTTTNVVDGATTTGTLSANTTAGKIFVLQNNGSTGNVGELTEAGFADNVAWSSTTIAALHANQSAYWGTP
ncbi:MAG TPA: hypothetical protein VGS13_05745 [Stellaceae bacterium]|nr:hypothetical protein [Stellaceae bacterium]